MTRNEIDELWEQGYRPYEIYISNPFIVDYFGEVCAAGTVTGWDIRHVFATKEGLKSYPFFDEIIGMSAVETCENT
jgi:hypothetical protein